MGKSKKKKKSWKYRFYIVDIYKKQEKRQLFLSHRNCLILVYNSNETSKKGFRDNPSVKAYYDSWNPLNRCIESSDSKIGAALLRLDINQHYNLFIKKRGMYSIYVRNIITQFPSPRLKILKSAENDHLSPLKSFDSQQDMDRMMKFLKHAIPESKGPKKEEYHCIFRENPQTKRYHFYRGETIYHGKDNLIPGTAKTYRDGPWNGGNNK